jgi:hypothetical protein
VIGDRVRVLLCSLIIVAMAGCKASAPELVSVKGKVQLSGGAPAVERVLAFQPLDESNKHTAPSPHTDKGGHFSTRCAKGRYKVTMIEVMKGSPSGMPGGGTAPPPAMPTAQTFEPVIIEVPEKGKEDFVLTFK